MALLVFPNPAMYFAEVVTERSLLVFLVLKLIFYIFFVSKS